MEAVRLVVWDLDETFWQGTLTEGGISYNSANHALVIELARRGIMSSICSKNDLTPVKALLRDKGLWDYFIFPSISWEAKGPRLAALVEAVQLRPETVLFIDDNVLNRNEALHYVPKLQVANEDIIPGLWDSPFLRGKDDAGLTRLAQYRLLESRQEAKSIAADNTAFLRASNIRVSIEHDLETNRARVIELINRTNQLNFTKSRISEDPVQQQRDWNWLARYRFHHGGLVRVRDDYGDYGFAGVYFIKSYQGEDELIHFCFSCRILGMGVEKYLYERLGRPRIKIVGEVLTDLFDDNVKINWINQGEGAVQGKKERLAGRIFMRGGCQISSAAHYLALNADEIVGEFNIARDELSVRLDHSLLLTHALAPPPCEAIEAACRIGFAEADFTTALADPARKFDVYIFSFVNDWQMAVYTHPATGLRVPFHEVAFPLQRDVRRLEREFPAKVASLIQQLRDEGYVHAPPSPALLQENLDKIMRHVPPAATVFFLLGPKTHKPVDGEERPTELHPFNQVLSAAAAARPGTYALDMAEFVMDPQDRLDTFHYGRMPYFRLSQKIAALLRARNEAEAVAENARAYG